MANEFQFADHKIEVTIMGQSYAFEVTDAMMEAFDCMNAQHSEAVAAADGDTVKIRAAGRQFNDALLALTIGQDAVDAIFSGRSTADLDKGELAAYIARLIVTHLRGTKNRAARRNEPRRQRK